MKRICCLLLVPVLLVSMGLSVSAEEPELPARSWCLMDAATGTVLRAGNEHEPLPPASVTKIMTLLLVMEAVDSGRLRWDDTVTASETAAAKGGSQIYLKAGETMTVEDMVKSIAVSSANDCACAMAELLAGSEQSFADLMNRRAEALGMKDTHFVNCTGLDDGADAASHRTSAYDIALMSRELLTAHPDIQDFTTVWMDSVRGGSFGLTNTNRLVRFYPGCTGLKTGFTSSAGFCLSASARRDDLHLIAVVLGCDSSKVRFDACRRLLDWGFASWALLRPELPGSCTVPVRLGTLPYIRAGFGAPPAVLVPKAQLSDVRTDLSLPPQLEAPVERGRQIGTLTVTCGETVLARLPVTALDEAGRLGFGDLFLRLLGRIAMAPGSFGNAPEPAPSAGSALSETPKNDSVNPS